MSTQTSVQTEKKLSAHTQKICKYIGIIFLVIGISAFAYKGYAYLNAATVASSVAPQVIGAIGLFVGFVFLTIGTKKD
jgi:hypothetical protein